MEEQNYQKQMRAYIELVKKMSFEAPLQQTLIDLKTMAKDNAYAHGMARSITNHGGMPVLVGRVGLTITAPWLKGRSYRMIDYNENVVKEGICETTALSIPNDMPVYLIKIAK